MKITVSEAANLLGVSSQFVRLGLQRGELPIGSAVKMSSVYTYHISRHLLDEYIGTKKPPCGNRTATATRKWQKGHDYDTTQRHTMQYDSWVFEAQRINYTSSGTRISWVHETRSKNPRSSKKRLPY